MIDIKNWEVGDLGLAKVTTLEGQLKDMIKLTVRWFFNFNIYNISFIYIYPNCEINLRNNQKCSDT